MDLRASTHRTEPSTPVPRSKILVVDDDEDIVNLLLYILEREDYHVVIAHDGMEGVKMAEAEHPDLIVLDVMMPKMDGMEFCRHLRKDVYLHDTPVLMLTALMEETDEVRSLDAGADDYITKPIAPKLFLSHVRALLRRTKRDELRSSTLLVRDLQVDRNRYVVVRTGTDELEEVSMPRKEFDLLYFLASHPGRVFSRQDLLDSVWGSNVYVVDRTIDVHIRKIREKLGHDYIETVKGVGYKFKP